MKINDIIYYFDENYRVYEIDGVRQNSPVYEKHFRPLVVINETSKEWILDWGTINKRSNLLKLRNNNSRITYYTEQDKLDDIYIHENGYKISKTVDRCKDAKKLKLIENILNENYGKNN
jgi:hypothetical protein